VKWLRKAYDIAETEGNEILEGRKSMENIFKGNIFM
jgi:hypothetical protein